VLARIIKALRDKGPSKRTALATATGISYDRLVLYLDWMISRGFVTLAGDGSVQLTAPGVQAYDQLVQWIIVHVGQLRLPRPRPPEEAGPP
jgi:predicted transcriptional regulator